MDRNEYFNLQREKGNKKNDFFNYPKQEEPLCKREHLEPLKYQISSNDYHDLMRLNNTDSVPVRLVNVIIKFNIPINYHEKEINQDNRPK